MGVHVEKGLGGRDTLLPRNAMYEDSTTGRREWKVHTRAAKTSGKRLSTTIGCYAHPTMDLPEFALRVGSKATNAPQSELIRHAHVCTAQLGGRPNARPRKDKAGGKQGLTSDYDLPFSTGLY